MNKWSRTFWQAAAERAIATLLQAGIAAIPVSVVTLQGIDWLLVGSTAGLAGLLSVVKSVIVNAGGSTGPGVGSQENLNTNSR